jgi:CheY-like chemotaxis protein
MPLRQGRPRNPFAWLKSRLFAPRKERLEKASGYSSIKLLYVEDVTDMRRMVAFTLPLMNKMFPTEDWPSVHVIEAEDGLDGVAKAKEYAPDVILMDLRLPGLSGTEAAMQIRQNPQTSHIPIIMITAFQEERVEEAAERVGAERAMHKPFEWVELMNTIVELANASP